MNRSLPALLLAASAALPIALAQDGGGHVGHFDACLLVPELGDDGAFAWTQPNLASHGGTTRLELVRDGPLAASTEATFDLAAAAEVRAAPLVLDGHTPWDLVLSLRATWEPATAAVAPPLPEPVDVVLRVDATVSLGHAPIADGAREIIVKEGVVDENGVNPAAALPEDPPADPYYARHLLFRFLPDGVPPGQAGTLDEVNTQFRFRLADPDPAASPGRLRIALELSSYLGGEGPGTQLYVPGACTPEEHAHAAAEGGGGGHEHVHASPAHSHAADGNQDELCTAVPGYCDPPLAAEPAASPPAAPPPAAAAPANTPAPAWGPAVVTATIGVAGVACFRPRRP